MTLRPLAVAGLRTSVYKLLLDGPTPMPQRANRDPLDVGNPSSKRWEEFRAQYSAALLTHWVFRDVAHEAADAVDDLWSRLQSSLNDYPELIRNDAAKRGEEWDGYVPFHGRDPKDIDWLHVDDLAALYESLFPHDLHNASIRLAIAGAVVIGLHSALETYTKGLGIDVKKGLVSAIRGRLSAGGEVLAADLVETLDDCDATRHVIVHNRRCVDEAYIRRVRNSPFQLGELRVLTDDLIDSFSRAVFSVAALLRKHDDSDRLRSA